jgi:hypothetical protein
VRGTRQLFATIVAILLALVAAQTVLGAVTIDTSGRTGAWTVADSATDAALRCTYDSSALTTITVAPPQVKAIARRHRQVGWEFQVWRAKFWQRLPDTDQWYLAYSSGISKASATNSTPAAFAPGQWTVPPDVRTAYDSFKVRVILHWFARDKVTEIGHVTLELEYYGVENVGEPFDPATSTFGPGHCPGSFNAPQPPDLGTRADIPAGFVRMSHWRPYWKNKSEAAVEADIQLMQRMHQTGVILTGMESGDRYALPADVDHYLQLYRAAGITPYLALWVGKFSDAETATSLRAWRAGNGQWAGIVLDVEAGLMRTVQAGRAEAVQALDRYMSTMRPLTPFMAYSTMAIASDYPDMLYSELNTYADVFMPQLYFNGSGLTALAMLDRLQASVDYESQFWAAPPKPIIPVVNDWGDHVNLEQLSDYIQIAFARYGAVSGWRIHPDMHEEVKDLWGSFDP